MLALALQNLTSPMVLFFALGLLAALARSDLTVPEALTKLLSLYLLLSIGFRGGVEVNHQGPTAALGMALLAGILLSATIPVVAFALLRTITRLTVTDAAALAGHYGSISAVTFATITATLAHFGIAADGYFVAVAAAMETPAIFSAVLLARSRGTPDIPLSGTLLREILFNGSIVVLAGAFVIGAITGPQGLAMLKPFVLDSFNGFLCLFLLDMGLVAGSGLRLGARQLAPTVILFAFLMPLISAVIAALVARLIGLSVGDSALLITLGASASYIAVPGAMRLALPDANPMIGITLALGLTFPFNLLIGIPLYIRAAQVIGAAGP
jgi:hypothetical protein